MAPSVQVSVDESAVAISSESAASDLDVLLATKLYVPGSNLGLIPGRVGGTAR